MAVLLMAGQIGFSRELIVGADTKSLITDKQEEQIMRSFLTVSSSFIIIYVLVVGIFVLYLNRYIQALIQFHSYLSNFKLTPRSRFIKKYQPQLDPLYEEMSHMESNSVTQRFSSFTPSSSNKKSSSQQITVNSQALSIAYGLRGSSIMFNERKGQFEEIEEEEDDY